MAVHKIPRVFHRRGAAAGVPGPYLASTTRHVVHQAKLRGQGPAVWAPACADERRRR